ncbi:MAG: ABC transporter permease [Chloroflexota bacterium]
MSLTRDTAGQETKAVWSSRAGFQLKIADRHAGRWVGAVIILLALSAWEVFTRMTATPVYLFPPPSIIGRALAANLPSLLAAGGVTLAEALAGLVLGSGIGLGLAILISFWVKLEEGVMSLAILLKSTPIIAIAPILTIWLGFGPAPKVVITAILTFFPILINALSGFRQADRAVIDLMQSWDAGRGEVFRYVRWPGARPYLLAALKVAVPLSLVGAVVAEWTGASSGLGRAMWLAYTNLNMPVLFAAVFVLTTLSVTLYGGVVWVEKHLIFW